MTTATTEPVRDLGAAFAKYDVRSCGRNFDKTTTFSGKTWEVVLRKVSAASIGIDR